MLKHLPLWRLRTMRRKVWEAVGSDRHSIPCAKEILNGLHKYLPSQGFFIEAGALDGFFESNTYYLERFQSWTGILIEPLPDMHARLKVNRPGARTFHCALVGSDYKYNSVRIMSAHAISRVVLNRAEPGKLAPVIEVPARTLSSIIDEVKPPVIDLLSLDVEGLELEVLRGLNLSMHRPRYILLECLTNDAKTSIDEYLRGKYECVDQFTYRDFLYAPCRRGEQVCADGSEQSDWR